MTSSLNVTVFNESRTSALRESFAQQFAHLNLTSEFVSLAFEPAAAAEAASGTETSSGVVDRDHTIVRATLVFPNDEGASAARSQLQAVTAPELESELRIPVGNIVSIGLSPLAFDAPSPPPPSPPPLPPPPSPSLPPNTPPPLPPGATMYTDDPRANPNEALSIGGQANGNDAQTWVLLALLLGLAAVCIILAFCWWRRARKARDAHKYLLETPPPGFMDLLKGPSDTDSKRGSLTTQRAKVGTSVAAESVDSRGPAVSVIEEEEEDTAAENAAQQPKPSLFGGFFSRSDPAVIKSGHPASPKGSSPTLCKHYSEGSVGQVLQVRTSPSTSPKQRSGLLGGPKRLPSGIRTESSKGRAAQFEVTYHGSAQTACGDRSPARSPGSHPRSPGNARSPTSPVESTTL